MKGAFRLLRTFCPSYLLEEIEGDLLQKFERDVKSLGERKAKRRLLWNVIRFFRFGILMRNNFSFFSNQNMIKNYFTVASRNILRHKLYSFINAFGLSIAIASCLLIYLFIQDEKSFDQFHANKNEIYLIVNKAFDFPSFKNGEKEPFALRIEQHAKLSEVVKEELSEVELATRYYGPVDALLRYKEKVFSEQVTCVDSSFFKMFSFRLLAGNRDRLFKTKNEIVITQKIAKKYFGTEDPIGKSIALVNNGENLLTVVGVIEEPPANSSLSFEMLAPLEVFPWFKSDWDNQSYPTFVQLYPNTDLTVFKTNLNKLYTKYTGQASLAYRQAEKIPEELTLEELSLINLKGLHLNSRVGWSESSDPRYSLILGSIAILILVIACINYISIALTSSSNRRKEVGIRKISGAARKQLIFQFSIESIVIACISMTIGLSLVFLFLPSFNSFTDKDITFASSDLIPFALTAILISCIVGLIAGSYPTFHLSRLKPVLVLQGKVLNKTKVTFVQPLIVIQYVVSAFLVLSAVVMYRQMRFITTKDLGYDQNQVLFIPTYSGVSDRSERMVENFRLATENDPSVLSVAGTSIAFTNGTLTLGYQNNGEFKIATSYIVDPDYIPTLGIRLIAGRNFDIKNQADFTDAVIVNETLVRQMKWKDPLKEHLNWKRDAGLGARIIGVVKDHNFLSLEKPVNPMFLTMDRTFGHYQFILVKISQQNIPGSIKRLEKYYKKIAPDLPFEYNFLDERVALQYKSYQRWRNIMSFAAVFAIVISSLGLFGLAGLEAFNRAKELSIRKILGASISSLFVLLNKQFIWLSMLAFCLAALPSWYIMNKWLDSFQFRIQLNWVLFLLSMLACVMVTLLTVSFHALKAIQANPAETLKNE